jgi:biotin carboxyl carrier protein
MLADREGLVRIRANLSGEVEIRVTVGQQVYTGQCLAVVEGDLELESLSVRNPSVVEEILVECGSEVSAGTCLLRVRELSD